MEEVTQILNAAAAAGPTVLLAIAIIIFVWRGLPLMDKLVNGIDSRIEVNNRTLEEVRLQIATSNQYNNANAKAVGDIAETFSLAMRDMIERQNSLVSGVQEARSAQLTIGNAMQQVAAASTSLHEVMEKSIERDEKRHLSLVGGISQMVTSIGEMSTELVKDIKELNEMISTRPRAATPEEYAWYRTNIQAILDCVLRIEGTLNVEPYKLTVPPHVTAYDVEVKKDEVTP